MYGAPLTVPGDFTWYETVICADSQLTGAEGGSVADWPTGQSLFLMSHPDVSLVNVSPMAGGRRQEQQRLIDISLDHNIEQTIDKPTRGGNILDLLFTNKKSTLQNVVIMPPLGKSDHDIIYAEINVRPNRMCTPHRKVFVFRKADWDGIKRKLNALFKKMQENVKQTPVNELWNPIKITLLDGMREFIPQKMTKSKHCLP